MRWQRKARVQNLVARLPARSSGSLYYFLQRRFGQLRSVNPLAGLITGVAILDHFSRQGGTPTGAAYLEIGAGRRLNVPLALWLGGARQITTVDLNRYLKADLVGQDVAWMRNFPWEVRRVFGPYSQSPLFRERFGQLTSGDFDLDRLTALMNLRYLSPADAARLPLEAGSVDCHVSCRVLEHIPVDSLQRIFTEGKRVLSALGRFVHLVDFADHFAPTDDTISTINFLQFSDAQWNAYAGNRYMYHNRLRVDDHAALWRRLGLETTVVEPEVDPRALAQLHGGFRLDARFADKTPETNATATAWLIGSKDA